MLISATLSGKRYLAVKHKFGTASKINMIVSFFPFNFERASVHHDLTAAACHSELCRVKGITEEIAKNIKDYFA